MVTDRSTGVLVMAYGTASGPDDIERYYTDIRGGRTPSPEHLEELAERYAAIGNVFPLLDDDARAGRGHRGAAERRRRRPVPRLPRDEAFAAVHPRGRRADARRRRRRGGRHRDGAALVRDVGGDLRASGPKLAISDRADRTADHFVRSYHDHPMFVDWVAERLRATLATLRRCRARARTTVMFTAHSLPVRTLDDGTQRCKTCDCDPIVPLPGRAAGDGGPRRRAEVGLDDDRSRGRARGRTADPWWGPPIDEMIAELAAEGRTRVRRVLRGFVADHLEILLRPRHRGDRRGRGRRARVRAHRMPNEDPAFCDVLAEVVREHLAGSCMKLDRLERELGPPAAGAPARAVGTTRARRRVPAGDSKVEDADFPTMEVSAAGYEIATLGQRAYNGVAIFPASGWRTRGPGSTAIPCPSNLAWSRSCRWGRRRVRLRRERQGGRRSAYETQARWLEALAAWLDATAQPGRAADRRRRLQHRARRSAMSGSGVVGGQEPAPASPNGSALRALIDWGLTDLDVRPRATSRAVRLLGLPGWGVPQRVGARIDLALGTLPIAKRLQEVVVEREERKPTFGEGKPSDHAPVIVTLT